MFWHNYLYRLKCIVRDKQTMFWSFIFPILLATLFNLAFSNLYSIERFEKINIGIIDNGEYKKNTDFIKAIDSVSNSDKTEGEIDLFNVKYTSKEEADKLLNNNKIDGYIYFDHGIELIVRGSGINQTIIKGFLDDFKQTSSTIATIIEKKPSAVQNGLFDSIQNPTVYLKEVALGRDKPDTTVNYFYALIAMACIYGSFMGVKEVAALQANLSPQGARVNMAPTHKLKLFITSMLAATTVQLFDILILLGYLTLILKVNFGSQLGYIALTCLIGTITGVSFGACIASIIKKGEGLKIAIIVVFTNLMSFLSGMMYDKMKYIISSNVPILGYLNPINLITDSLYSLYYYETHTQFFINIVILCGFAVLFTSITYLVLRRQRYASL